MSADGRARLRLRELRLERGWTQQNDADVIARVAWMRHREKVAVNADMVAKWERGAKGISPRYRQLLCAAFGVTADQLGLPTAADPMPGQRQPEREVSLLSMLEGAGSLLDQLGPAGVVLQPQMFAVWKDEIVTRPRTLALLTPAAQGGGWGRHSAAAAIAVDDLDELAERYEALYRTATPAALLTPVAAHLRMIDEALRGGGGERRRLHLNRARVAVLAGRLAFDDLGIPLAGRAYYSLAADAAREVGDHDLAATAYGYTAQLSAAEGNGAAAVCHLAAASGGVLHPLTESWLATIEATMRADADDQAAARAALDRAGVAIERSPNRGRPSWLSEQTPAVLAAATGHVLLRAGDHSAAIEMLAGAVDQLPNTARRARVLSGAQPLGCLLCLVGAKLGDEGFGRGKVRSLFSLFGSSATSPPPWHDWQSAPRLRPQGHVGLATGSAAGSGSPHPCFQVRRRSCWLTVSVPVSRSAPGTPSAAQRSPSTWSVCMTISSFRFPRAASSGRRASAWLRLGSATHPQRQGALGASTSWATFRSTFPRIAATFSAREITRWQGRT